MKSLYLSLFSLLTFFVITSKASIKGLETENKAIENGGYKIWLPEVNGYDKNDEKNGFAGLYDEPITSFRVSGGKPYTVHILNEEEGWFKSVNDSFLDDNRNHGYAGFVNGKPIDGIVIADNVEYTVHVVGGDWLPPIHGDPHDLDPIPPIGNQKPYRVATPPKQFAGIIGKAIDAVMVKDRTYATSFFSPDQCFPKGGTCMNPSNCKGNVESGLCPGSSDNKCCIPVDNSTTFSIIDTVIILLSALMIIAIILYYVLYIKKKVKKDIMKINNMNKPPPYEKKNQNQNQNRILNITENEEESLLTKEKRNTSV